MAYSEVLQLFNDEIYPVHIPVKKSLIKVAIYEINGIKWGTRSPKFAFGAVRPASPPRDAYASS